MHHKSVVLKLGTPGGLQAGALGIRKKKYIFIFKKFTST